MKMRKKFVVGLFCGMSLFFFPVSSVSAGIDEELAILEIRIFRLNQDIDGRLSQRGPHLSDDLCRKRAEVERLSEENKSGLDQLLTSLGSNGEILRKQIIEIPPYQAPLYFLNYTDGHEDTLVYYGIDGEAYKNILVEKRGAKIDLLMGIYAENPQERKLWLDVDRKCCIPGSCSDSPDWISPENPAYPVICKLHEQKLINNQIIERLTKLSEELHAQKTRLEEELALSQREVVRKTEEVSHREAETAVLRKEAETSDELATRHYEEMLAKVQEARARNDALKKEKQANEERVSLNVGREVFSTNSAEQEILDDELERKLEEALKKQQESLNL